MKFDLKKKKFVLEIKPLSVNALWQGRRFKTEEYKNYSDSVAFLLPKAEMIKGYVEIHYRFFLRNWKRTDGDNLVKGLQDILVKAGFIEDDAKIMKYVIEKIPCEENKIEVEIKKRNPRKAGDTDVGRKRKNS